MIRSKAQANKKYDYSAILLFALSSGMASIIFAYHLQHSWNFPWHGNPDQDLVFLRDGLRIARLETPGYSDHPGLVQMLIGAISHLAEGSTAKTRLNDQDWQRVFEVQKIANSAAMAFLIGSVSVLLGKLTSNKRVALLLGIICALSIGTTTLVYQLRNEFFSAYLFYAAALIVAGIAKSRIKSATDTGPKRRLRPADASSYSLLAMLSLLAKVQVLPLFVLLSLGLAGWIYGWNLSALKQLVKNTCRATVLSAALLAAFKIVGIDVGANFIASLSVLALAATPLYIAATAGIEDLGCFTKEEKLITLTFGAACLGYAAIAHACHWQHISWNPFSAGKYTSTTINENAPAWLLSKASDGYALLFERTFDGQLLAHLLALIVPLTFIIILACLKTNRPSKHWRNPKSRIVYLSSVYLFLCATIMASMASLRWPVDHYLPYQQPLLILSLLLIGTSARAHLLFRIISAYMAVSVILLNLSYPKSAYATYVKNTIPRTSDLKHGRSHSNMNANWLCASQHAGTEWRGSIVGKSCGY